MGGGLLTRVMKRFVTSDKAKKAVNGVLMSDKLPATFQKILKTSIRLIQQKRAWYWLKCYLARYYRILGEAYTSASIKGSKQADRPFVMTLQRKQRQSSGPAKLLCQAEATIDLHICVGWQPPNATCTGVLVNKDVSF